MRDLRRHGVTTLTLVSIYSQITRRWYTALCQPGRVWTMKAEAPRRWALPMPPVAPFARSSYHADLRAKGMEGENDRGQTLTFSG